MKVLIVEDDLRIATPLIEDLESISKEHRRVYDFATPSCARAAAVRGLLASAILNARLKLRFGTDLLSLSKAAPAGRNGEMDSPTAATIFEILTAIEPIYRTPVRIW